MPIYQRPGSKNHYYRLSIKGLKFRGSCGTADRATALKVERETRERLRREIVERRKPELTLDAALLRYWQEHAERLPSADNIALIGKTLIAGLGADTLLSELTRSDIATFVARRRAHLADSSVNRELTILRAVIRMAALTWGVAIADIDWKRQFLTEPAPRDRFLGHDEEQRLFAVLRPDFHPLVRFALLSGVRVSNARLLRWDQIAWPEGVARLRIKSKKPGGDTLTIVLTKALRAILSTERGRHPIYVFTFVPQRARSAAGRAEEPVNGARFPFTRDGWRKAWGAALKAAGIEDFRFHDLRHTFGTRFYKITGDIRRVQKAIGHRDISSTLRYENSGVEGLRADLELLDQAGEIAARKRRRRRSE